MVYELEVQLHTIIDDDANSKSVLENMSICRGKLSRKNLCRAPMPMKRVAGETDDFAETVQDYKDDIERTISEETRALKRQILEEKKERKMSGDELRVVTENKIGQNTIMKQVYDLAVNEILNLGKGVWHARSKIVDLIIDSNEMTQSRCTIEGHLRSVYQTKCSIRGVTENVEGVMLMKKTNDLVYMRIN
jgi:hypothetical protein